MHRVLSQQLKKLPSPRGKLEFLALKWAITEQFRDYLYYLYYSPEFTVCANVCYAECNKCTLGWRIKYRPGKSNNDADTLSRLPLNIEDYIQTCCQGSSSEVVQAAICSARLQSQGDVPWLTALTDSITAIDDDYNSPSIQQHLGLERVFDLAKSRFYWPNMKEDIIHYVTKVCRCLKQKPPAMKQREPLPPIITTAPFQMVSVDFLHLEASTGGYEYILVVMDHFTRYASSGLCNQRQVYENSCRQDIQRLHFAVWPPRNNPP